MYSRYIVSKNVGQKKKTKFLKGNKKWPFVSCFYIDIQQPMQCLNITLRNFFFMLLFFSFFFFLKKRFFDNFVFFFGRGAMCVRISFDGTGFWVAFGT